MDVAGPLVACAADEPHFAEALAKAGLPACAAGAQCFAFADGRAFGALDGDGADRLMRSVVVSELRRGEGIGAAMVERLAEMARASGTERLWLLTTDAPDFFARLGWTIVDRASASAAIRASDQFATLCPASCPASAILMVRDLAR